MDKIEILEKEVAKTRNSLSTDRLDMSFGEIMSMYERNEIIIAPEFQRLFRWSQYQQSRFIESILLGIPIPPIFVAEDKEGKWELVDGLQRVSTILSFFGVLKTIPEKNNWLLCKGDLVSSLENLACKDLPVKFQLNIKRAVCRIEIIKWNSEYDMRYELFNRLNTGGSELTDQEIRNCIFRGVSSGFNEFLRRLSTNIDFVELIEPTEKQLAELYMDELVLRFCALYDSPDNIVDNISQHMTNYMREIVKDSKKIPYLEKTFLRLIKILKPIGRDVFRGVNHVFSTSLFDCVSYGIAHKIDVYENERTDKIIDKIKLLKNDDDFKKSSGSAAASKTRILKE